MQQAYQKLKIGDLGKVITGRTPPSSKPECFGELYPFVTPTDMHDRKAAHTTERYLSEDGAVLLKRNLLPPGSVSVSCIGWQMGKSILISRPSFSNQQLNTVIPNEKVDSDYLYYLLTTKREQLFSIASATGVRTPILNKSSFSDIEVEIPKIEIQRKIAPVLTNYDNLIENNNRRIAILEDMARCLYREWFVKFRFPGHENCQFKDSVLGEIPDGWDVKAVEECYKTSSGGTPSRKKPEYYGDDHWWTKTKELKDGFITSVDEKISDLGLSKSSAKLFPKDTVLLAMYGATIGRLGILTNESATNQACCALIPLEKIYSPWFIYLTLLSKRPDLLSLGQGAAQQNISQQVIKGFKFLLPELSILDQFNSGVEPMFREIELLLKSNKNLKKQRDLLLPKLISGKIEI
ncbi:MAG: restriction endonuclease subunit S [Gammaproteobacteria bacterium]|nr:restriction endonuclease subunit S [Gammaproteobacteria bacterium]